MFLDVQILDVQMCGFMLKAKSLKQKAEN